MANLAIKGHATRGKEVIEILEILGGKNKYSHFGESESYFFFIQDGIIDCDEVRYADGYLIFTIEEFLEKFPYKIGDKVIAFNEKCSVANAFWDKERNEVLYTIHIIQGGYVRDVTSSEIQSYKEEETMEDYLVTEDDYEKTLEVEQEYIAAAERLINQLAEGTHWKCKDFDSQKMIAMFLKRNIGMITKKEGSTIIVDIPKGYEFAGVDDNNQQVVFEKIGCQYPKTYEECAKLLNTYCGSIGGYNWKLLSYFQQLLICCDAYWKVIGENMGLDKPWEPDWNWFGNPSYPTIVRCNNRIIKTSLNTNDCIFVFPTEEMRDAFYENFKDLIEQCKELL